MASHEETHLRDFYTSPMHDELAMVYRGPVINGVPVDPLDERFRPTVEIGPCTVCHRMVPVEENRALKRIYCDLQNRSHDVIYVDSAPSPL